MSQFLGVAFSPYVGNWKGNPPNAQVPDWNSYSQQDIVRMLEVIAPHFDKISTYSMGVAAYYPPTTPWNQVDSNCLVAGAAAQLNQQMGKVAIQVAQGIYQHTDAGLQQAEIEAAFSAAKAANAVYPNTVTSLVFTNEYVVDPQTANAVNAMIVSNKQRAHDLNIKVGVRSHTFGEIANPHSHFYNQLKTLIQNCDFIQCNLYPGKHTATPTDGVNQVGQAFHQIKTAVADINPQCEVMIGETGWSSQGISFNETDNNVANLLAYYEAIKKWAFENRALTYLFEAIDEPWKSNQNSSDTLSPGGPNGAEGHYGLWYLNPQGGYTHKGIPSLGLRVALKASNEQYVSADFNQGGQLVANRDQISDWETFELIKLDGNKNGLRADNGQYVSADFNQGGQLVANRDRISDWETFELIKLDGNQIGLRADNGQYVSADFNEGGKLVANRDEIEGWETFELIER